MAHDLEAHALLGGVLAERYVLERVLGQGGYGAVLLATDQRLSRPVAVKVLRPQASAEETTGRFLREARILASIAHPNVVNIMDCGQQGDLLYIVMELVLGSSLAKVLQEHFPLQASRIALISEQILRALEEAHALGIVHRDLKPDNVLVAPQRDGSVLVKVVDFGTAVFREQKEGFHTREGILVGTPEYMSPEQCRDQALDGRSDLYAFGCILYELMVGEPPFLAENPLDIMVSHLYHEPVLPSRRRDPGSISPALETLALWCLAKLPSERPSSANALRLELTRASSQGLNHPVTRTGQATRIEASAETHRSVASSAPAEGESSRARVLALASSPTTLHPVVEVLRARGHAVETASSVPPIELLTEVEVAVLFHSEAFSSGWLERLRAVKMPVLVCGPDDDLTLMATALEKGAYDFVPIPVNPMALGRSVARAAKARRRGHG